MPFAVLVACSVEKAKQGGYHDRSQVAIATSDGSSKVSAREFAERAGTEASRVLRYLEGWARAWLNPVRVSNSHRFTAIIPCPKINALG